MRRAMLLLLSSLCLVPTAACAQPASGSEVPAKLDWRVESDDRADGRVQLDLGYRTAHNQSHWSRTVDLAELEGFGRDQLAGTSNAPVRFRIVKDPGSFDCEGVAWRGHGTGDCRFVPDPRFTAELARRGYGAPRPDQLFSMALGDVGLAYIDELARQGYARTGLDSIVDAGNHGAGLAYLREMGALGYRVGTLEALIRMRDHGVDAAYVRELVASGLKDLPADSLVEMRDHGVSPSYIGALRRLGYDRLPMEDLIRLRDHGVTGDYLRALAGLGYRDLGADEVTRLRDYGITADYIKEANRGGARRSVDELIRLRTGG
jgi:hypothetical protein